MKFEGSGSKGTRVIERNRSVTDGQTDRRTRQKQYVSPRGGGDIITQQSESMTCQVSRPIRFKIKMLKK